MYKILVFPVTVVILQMYKVTGQTGAPYNVRCPHRSQWNLKAKGFCTNNTLPSYYCLLDVNKQTFTEFCRKTQDFQRPGFQFVMRGGLDGQMCSNTHFQPFKFMTDRSSQCELIKTDCNEEGQIVLDDGNQTVDRSCRCDYSKGYDFVTKPSNGCSCILGIEDCTCYFRSCGAGYVLTPDYQCEKTSEWTGNFNCPVIKSSYTIREDEQKTRLSYANDIKISRKDDKSMDLKRRSTILISLAIAWNITAIFILVFTNECSRQIQNICRAVMHVEVEVKLASHETQFQTT